MQNSNNTPYHLTNKRNTSLLLLAGLSLFFICQEAKAANLREKIAGCENKKPPYGKEFQDSVTGMEFVYVQCGCFEMGDTFGDGDSNEKPVHTVCLDNFYMGKYEVTQAEWQKIMGSNPSYFKGERRPVEEVSWNDAQKFIKKLNSQSGKKFALPGEAQWEYAARSGGKKEKYAGGNEPDAVAWYDSNSGGETHEVGLKAPNGLGLYDMSGNVREWCQDSWHSDYDGAPADGSAWVEEGGSLRVVRGGSWSSLPGRLRAAYRYWGRAVFRISVLGFRLVLPAY